MVVTIKRRIIRRGGVSPPALETQRFTAKSVDLWLLYFREGKPLPYYLVTFKTLFRDIDVST